MQVFLLNPQTFPTFQDFSESNQEIDQVEWLIRQRKEVHENIDFLVKLLPLKSKALLKEIQETKKSSKELSSGEKYYSIIRGVAS